MELYGLVNIEIAKLAKEKGFNEKVLFCFPDQERSLEGGFYNYNYKGSISISRPTRAVVQKWLREKNIFVVIDRKVNTAVQEMQWIYLVYQNNYLKVNSTFTDNYEEALEAGLLEALKLIKN